ncbi:uncharacterized protein ACIBXB_020998 [Morphnus guianensis]
MGDINPRTRRILGKRRQFSEAERGGETQGDVFDSVLKVGWKFGGNRCSALPAKHLTEAAVCPRRGLMLVEIPPLQTSLPAGHRTERALERLFPSQFCLVA